eukprot:SM001097S18858  [mRNA]  locus=s1097:1636:2108:- [translate_table: standard]
MEREPATEDMAAPSAPTPARTPPPLASWALPAQAAIVVAAFGFVDAGYSGDWSRIGAISSETEALLRAAAFVVVPAAGVLAWSIQRRSRN